VRGGAFLPWAQERPGRAHQPYLEDPGQVADLLLDALAAT